MRFGHLCDPCNLLKNRVRRVSSKYSVTAYKKAYCEKCSFVAIASCQLDVDHKDGNRENGNPDNLQTLCANCHRLKTFLEKESGSWAKQEVMPQAQLRLVA